LKKSTGYLLLMRPANIVTSIADVLAGIGISGFFLMQHFEFNHSWPVFLLCLSTIGLYGGGVVFNDVFDAKLDAVERPERPIPSGVITVTEATSLGSLLLVTGIASAAIWNLYSGLIALTISVAALVYNKWGKHHDLIGPVNMGICRGLNLLLGVSIYLPALNYSWYLAFVPIIYIASITMVSRGEVHGGSKNTLYFAMVLYLVVTALILYVAWTRATILLTVLFLLPFCWMILKPLLVAIREPVGKNIGKAVKAGVIGLIIMDASWASAYGAWYLAVIILLLLPLSLYLSRLFAVT
jgi:4-hydroxybenzoate polyprenyltransferase